MTRWDGEIITPPKPKRREHGDSIFVKPIHGAEWQSGVTEDHDSYRIFLDDEPVIGAIAASVAFGWVDVCFGTTLGRGEGSQLQGLTGVHRRQGRVEIRRTKW